MRLALVYEMPMAPSRATAELLLEKTLSSKTVRERGAGA